MSCDFRYRRVIRAHVDWLEPGLTSKLGTISRRWPQFIETCLCTHAQFQQVHSLESLETLKPSWWSYPSLNSTCHLEEWLIYPFQMVGIFLSQRIRSSREFWSVHFIRLLWLFRNLEVTWRNPNFTINSHVYVIIVSLFLKKSIFSQQKNLIIHTGFRV